VNLHLTITELELWTQIGVTPEEREVEQRVLATITVTPRSRKALTSDRLADTVDYDDIVAIAREAAKKPHQTLEALTHDIGRSLLKQHRLQRLTVHVQKFSLPGAASAAVGISLP